MTITEIDIKKLWGLSAGRCNYPSCTNKCIDLLDISNPTILGEMAHVIAESPKGPRGIAKGGDNTYLNLILLCPHHHNMIDKAPKKFPANLLYKWKENHERKVRKALDVKKFANKNKLFSYISKILIENYSIWKQFGPESKEAKKNPISTLYIIWNFKKIDTIIPNNTKIINAIKQNEDFFNCNELKIANLFINHANAFEQSNYSRIEGVPKFPKRFEEMINAK
ncbi:MAG: HNH endonuclease signature motif containing protein [Endomicrobiaceae bacterium]|nr:HNH endonuclease signature motif containing protein [Endomicrobiaceae bacterium]